MRSLWRSFATFIGIRSVEDWSRSRKTGSGRAFGTIRWAYAEPWKSNRNGQLAREAGNCLSGCAIEGTVLLPPLPPRSPKARDRGHPRMDETPLEIRTTRHQTLSN
jgi:hypothetical protein